MRGLHFLGDRRLALESYPDPHPGPGEVVVKIGRAAVCGTDIHKYRAPAETIETLPDGAPLIVGHEPAGWIAEIGEGVTGLQSGDRVLLAGVVGCGRCAWCRHGYNTACEAGVSGLGWKRHGCDATQCVSGAGRLPSDWPPSRPTPFYPNLMPLTACRPEKRRPNRLFFQVR